MNEPAAPREDFDPAATALLDLARERPWSEISLRDVAERAGVELVDLYGEARGKAAILWRISEMLDRAALRTAATPSEEDPHDRLFDAAMARIEAMEPHRPALVALSREAPRLVAAAHFPATARAILEAAGVPATAPRVAGMTLAWARVVQVWRDDEGALNRTMAELDKRLRQLRSRLGRIGAGF
ncbi:MAG TPA: TetR family transcriptional regulator [Caulobacteraceae bacterium]